MLILASASPRRLQLLAQVGVTPAKVVPADIDATPQKGELPLISRIGLVETPGLAMSNNRKLIPPCLDSLDVRTRQNMRLACCAKVVQILVPLIT